jgi:hypothetical protein
LRNSFDREGAVFRVLLSDFSHLLIRWIVVPGVNGINAGIPINDDTLWRLAIDGYDLISTSAGPTRREQLSTMGLNEFSRLWQILLRVSL